MTGKKIGLNADQFNVWLANADAGESICYFVGEWATELDSEDCASELKRLRRQLAAAHADKRILFTQRRVAAHSFEYLAVKRRAPEGPKPTHMPESNLVPA